MGNSTIVNLPFKIEARSVCSELHYGAFLVQQNRSHFGFYHGAWAPASTKLRRTLGQTSSPKTKQKRKNTLYLSHKNPFNDWQLYLTPWINESSHFGNFSIDLWLRLFSTFSLLSLYCILPAICTSSSSGSSLSHRGGAKRSDEPQETMGRRKKKAVSFPPSFARILSRRETCLDTRQVFPRPVLGDFGHLLYFFSV